MIPKLRFPEFSGDWGIKKLGSIYPKIRNGFVGTATPFYVSKGHKYIQGKDIKAGKIQNTVDVFVSDSFYEKNKKSILHTNDIVVVQSGHVGECAVVNDEAAGANCHALIIMSSNLPTASAFYVSYLYSPQGKSRLSKATTGNTIKHILASDMKKMLVPSCSTEEAEKIARFLTVLDERVAVISKKVELLQQYKKGIIQKIFTQRLKFKDENGHSYPDWQAKKLGKLEEEERIKLGRGEVISKEDIANNPGNYPIYSSSVKNDGLFGRYGKYMFDEELITWSVDGGGHFFYRPAGRFSVTNVSGWLRVQDVNLSCKFLSLQLQRLHERLIFDYQTKAHPSVIRQLYSVRLPCLEEQQKIADFLTSLDDKINLEKAKLEQAKLFKKSLLQRMFV